MDESPDFNTQFYNLTGNNVNDLKKNFRKLLHSTSSDVVDQFNIKPRNQLEEIFYVDILIKFKKTQDLLQILKDGKGLLTSKILKEKWFFQEVFNDLNDDEIIQLLSSFSYSVRHKVLKKIALSLNEEKMDKVFECILNRYGISSAQPLLFSCSYSKITETINIYDLNLQPEQLKRILQKNPELIKLYMSKYKENTGKDYDDILFLKYLCWKCPSLYYDLGLNNTNGIRLGKCTTKNVLKLNKEDILKDIKNQNIKMHEAVLTRNIPDFHKVYLTQILPVELEDIKSEFFQTIFYKYICTYPTKKRWEIMSEAFQQTYKKHISEHVELFGKDFGAIFPKGIQQKWARLMYSKTDDSEFLTFCDAKETFELLKEKCNITSNIKRRETYLTHLISVCYKNKDYASYEEVLKYISSRHRNENLQDVLEYIFDHFDMKEANGDHTKYISEIFNIQRAKGNIFVFNLSHYLMFLFDCKLPMEEAIKRYINDRIKDNNGLQFFSERNPEGERFIYIKTAEIALEADIPHKESFIARLLNAVVSFSTQNPDMSIDLNHCQVIGNAIQQIHDKNPPYTDSDYEIITDVIDYRCTVAKKSLKACNDDQLLCLIKKMSEEMNYRFYETVERMLVRPLTSKFENDLLEFYFSTWFPKVSNNFKSSNVILYTLQNKPDVLKKYFNMILEYDTSRPLLKYEVIKNYSHWGFDQDVIKHFSSLVDVNMKHKNRKKLLKALSKLMSSETYLDLVKDYLPKQKTIDFENENDYDFYQVQCEVIKSLKNLEQPEKIVPILPVLCQGDYLQVSLGTVQNILCRVCENTSLYYINSLQNQPVSLKKHSVYLAFQLLPLHLASDIFLSVSDNEYNVSLRKYMFKSILKYFLKNPYDFLLNTVINRFATIEKDDQELLTFVTASVDSVPNRYKHSFIEKLWNTLESYNDIAKTAPHQIAIMKSIQTLSLEVFSKLSDQFCKTFIEKYFLSTAENSITDSNRVFRIVVKYLEANPVQDRFQYVFTIVKSYKQLYWEGDNPRRIDKMFRFFNVAFRRLDELDIEFLNTFTDYWEDVFDKTEDLYGHCQLKLMNFYKKHLTNLEVYFEQCNQFFTILTQQYGSYINLMLYKSIRNFFSSIAVQKNKDFTIENFVFYLVKIDQSELNIFLAAIVVNDSVLRNRTTIEPIIEILKQQSSESAKILYFSIYNKH